MHKAQCELLKIEAKIVCELHIHFGSCSVLSLRNGGLLNRESYRTRHTECGNGSGLAGGPRHLKPIREHWNIPPGSSTLARGHCKGSHREGLCNSDANKQPAR